MTNNTVLKWEFWSRTLYPSRLLQSLVQYSQKVSLSYALNLYFLCSLFEALTWFLVYNTSEYKKNVEEIEKLREKSIFLSKKNWITDSFLYFSVEKKKQSPRDKHLAQLEAELKAATQKLSSYKMKSTLLVSVLMITLIGLVYK